MEHHSGINRVADWRHIIDKYYHAGETLRDILLNHSRSVAGLALKIAETRELPLSRDLIESAAMLHDIGIFRTHAPSISCIGDSPYICHGIIGAELLREEKSDEAIARVAERHTGSGLTAYEIEAQNLPLPRKDFLPETLLEKLICYADKFYSKSGDMKMKDFERVRSGLAHFGPESLERFDALTELFGRPQES